MGDISDTESQLLPLLPVTHNEGARSRLMLFLTRWEMLHSCAVNSSEGTTETEPTEEGRGRLCLPGPKHLRGKLWL